MTLCKNKLNELLGRFVTDVGGSFHASNAVLGDRLGLYLALQLTMPATPEQVAAEARVAERYVREWLAGQAAGGYVTYDPTTGRYSLTEEQAFLLADTAGMQAAAAFHVPVAVARTSSGSPRRSAPVAASRGTNTTPRSSRASSGSSAQ